MDWPWAVGGSQAGNRLQEGRKETGQAGSEAASQASEVNVMRSMWREQCSRRRSTGRMWRNREWEGERESERCYSEAT